jgi:hypothetical protein
MMSQQPAFFLSEAQRALLLAIARYHYLTAAQTSRLIWPHLHDENRYAQRKLRDLASAGYVLALRALERPQYGQKPYVYVLADKGRKYVTAAGGSVARYFRPSEEKAAVWNSPFMQHRLDTIDVLLAAERLTHAYPVTCPRLLTERELKHGALRVTVPAASSWTAEAARSVAVIPDGWFQLSIDGGRPVSIALELDRATEDQKVWRQKVAAYAVWATGPYREAFETDNLTIAVVCPGDQRRRDLLTDWTTRELASRSLGELAEIFLFTAADAARVSPTQFFFSPLWVQPHRLRSLSLLDPPTLNGEVAFPVA